MVVFCLFEKLRCSNERSTKFDSLYHEKKCLELNCKGLYGILQLLQGSHLDNFSLKTLKLGWVAFYS